MASGYGGAPFVHKHVNLRVWDVLLVIQVHPPKVAEFKAATLKLVDVEDRGELDLLQWALLARSKKSCTCL